MEDGLQWVGAKIQLAAQSEIHKRREVGSQFALPGGVCLAPTLYMHIHDPADYKDDSSRQWQKGPTQRWVTFGTQVELGGESSGSLPLGSFASVSGGMGFKTAVELQGTVPMLLTVAKEDRA